VAELIEPVDVQRIAEENPTSRFKITNVAVMNPGVCFVCGSSGGDSRQFVDYGKTIDFYGVVYVCTFCIAEVAKLLGFLNRKPFEEEIDQLQNGCIQRDLEIDNLQEQLNAARILLRNCHCDPDSTNPTVLDSLEADPEPESDDPDVDESGDVEGFGDVSESSSDDEPVKPKRRSRTNPSNE
jgi:hypothetical protein